MDYCNACEELKASSIEIVNQNSAKKQKLDVDEIQSDPLKLPEPVRKEILKYFKGKELLEIREVTSYWKSYIESSNFLMNRAMDQIVARFLDDDDDHMEQMMRTNMKVKHMRSFFLKYKVSNDSFLLYPLIEHFAVSLVTIDITMVFCGEFQEDIKDEEVSIPPIKFPLLKNLEIFCDGKVHHENIHRSMAKFLTCSDFPEVTHLYLSENFFNDGNFTSFLSKFPKLKHFEISNEEEITVNEEDENLPKLEHLILKRFGEKITRAFKNTLLNLELGYWDDFGKAGLIFLISNLPMLKKLTIDISLEDESNNDPYPQHNNLEELSIEIYNFEVEDLHELFWAFPSLKVLTLANSYSHFEVDKDTISFLGKGIVFKLFIKDK